MLRLLPVRIVVAVVLGVLLLASGPALGVDRPLSSPSLATADTSDRNRLQAQKLFVRGMTEAYLEDYEEAISYFERALDLTPQEPSILIALADAQAAQENYTSALFYARQARKTGRTQPYYARRLAELQRETGQPRKAVETYQDLLSQFPNDLNAHLSLARLYTDLEDPEAALQTYETLLEQQDPSGPDVYLEMLPLYRQVGDEEGIEKTLKSLIDFQDDNPLYRRLLGQLYTERGQLDEAIELFESVLNERPDDADLLSRLTLLYQEQGRSEDAQTLATELEENDAASPDQLVAKARSIYRNATTDPSDPDTGLVQTALDLLEKARNRSPSHVDALDLLGTIQYERGEYAEAGQALKRALDEDPRSVNRWSRAASAFLDANEPETAANVAEEGLLLFPGQYRLAWTAAFARLHLQNNEAALEHFTEALQLLNDEQTTDRERAELQAGLGLAYDRLGHLDEAAEAYNQALSLHPRQPMALNNYAYRLAEQGEQLDRALELAQRAVNQNPSHPEYLDTLGWVYFHRGNLEKAKSHLQKAVETGNAPAIVYQHFGDVHEALGNDELAREYWQQALDKAPNREALRKKLGVDANE